MNHSIKRLKPPYNQVEIFIMAQELHFLGALALAQTHFYTANFLMEYLHEVDHISYQEYV